MDKVYIITISDLFDFEAFDHDPEAFIDKDKAFARFRELVKQAKEYAEANDWVDDDSSKTSYSSYPDGYWGSSHFDVAIYEVELK